MRSLIEKLKQNTLIAILKYLLISVFCLILGDAVSDLIGTASWQSELTFLLFSQVFLFFIFWKRRYANYSFKFSHNVGQSFPVKNLYFWSAVACVGCVLFDMMLQEILPIEAWDTMIWRDSDPEPSSYLIFDAIGLYLLAPIVEEGVCRGAIERRLLERFKNPWIAILISAIIFSAMHLNLTQGVTFLGVLVGWVYYCTRNLWPCIFIHVLNNILVSLWDFQSIPLGISIPLLVMGMVILYFSMRQIARSTNGSALIPVEAISPIGLDSAEGIETEDNPSTE